MIRGFVGVDIAPEVRIRIAEATAQLARQISGIRRVPQENYHFTLKFLGAIEDSNIEPIGAALAAAIRPFPRFTISAKRLGVFPDFKRARVLWVGVEGNQLALLVERVESVLEPFGFPRENRTFRPHLTVGRWRHFSGSGQKLEDELQRWSDVGFGQSAVGEVILFQSVLGPDGAVYRPLRKVRLTDESEH